MNKFASLAADVSKPFRVELIDPVTEEVIRDKEGKVAYIDVWSTDGPQARQHGKSKRKELNLRIKQSRNGKVEPNDQLEENIALVATLTNAWYLVDRVTGEPIDVLPARLKTLRISIRRPAWAGSSNRFLSKRRARQIFCQSR
ncbi:hypothetical protein ACVWZL_003312 [Bradyrhizobium sp. GM2.4]